MTIAELTKLQGTPLTKSEHGIVAGAIKRLRQGYRLTDKQVAGLDRILQAGTHAVPKLPLGRNFKPVICEDCGAELEWPTGYLRHMQAEHRDLPGVRRGLEKIRADREAQP